MSEWFGKPPELSRAPTQPSSPIKIRILLTDGDAVEFDAPHNIMQMGEFQNLVHNIRSCLGIMTNTVFIPLHLLKCVYLCTAEGVPLGGTTMKPKVPTAPGSDTKQ